MGLAVVFALMFSWLGRARASARYACRRVSLGVLPSGCRPLRRARLQDLHCDAPFFRVIESALAYHRLPLQLQITGCF